MINKFKLEKKTFDLIEVYWGSKNIGSFVKDLDGFFIYFPNKIHDDKLYIEGGFTESLLRDLADLLKNLNKEWKDIIEEHFKYPTKVFSEQAEFTFNKTYETSRNTNNQ